MTDAQIFQMIGLVYAAIGLGIFMNPDFYRKLIDTFADSPAAMYVGAIMAFVIGFILVSFHNVWVAGWPVIITIFGYLALIKGLMIIVFPRAFTAMSKKMIAGIKNLRLYAAIAFIIGLGLMHLGFIK